MPHRKPELQRIIKDLEQFVATTCEYDPKHPKHPRHAHDFVGEKCSDAILMLREANDGLATELKEEANDDPSRLQKRRTGRLVGD